VVVDEQEYILEAQTVLLQMVKTVAQIPVVVAEVAYTVHQT
jgi:hypothetical protein